MFMFTTIYKSSGKAKEEKRKSTTKYLIWTFSAGDISSLADKNNYFLKNHFPNYQKKKNDLRSSG